MVNEKIAVDHGLKKTEFKEICKLKRDFWSQFNKMDCQERISAFVPKNVSANKITIIGFLIGLIAVLLIFFKLHYLALIMILINRFFDGLDGAIARRNGATSFGGYLDITCDLIFYSAVIFGFALADPGKNGLASLFLVFSFVGTGTSFLAFAAISKKHDLFSKDQHGKINISSQRFLSF